jgi:hypothetical protein
MTSLYCKNAQVEMAQTPKTILHKCRGLINACRAGIGCSDWPETEDGDDEDTNVSTFVILHRSGQEYEAHEKLEGRL